MARVLDEANVALCDAMAAEKSVVAAYASSDEIQKIRPHLAPFIPRDKPSRTVTIGDYIPLPCGGTHIANLRELGAIRITKTKRAKENVRVSYAVSAV